MVFRWLPQRGIYIATVTDTRGAKSMDHHFEADPKVLHTEELWLEWAKLVADFMAERGKDVSIVKTKMRDIVDVYLGEMINEQKQTPETGGSDDGCGPDSTIGERPAVEPISPDFAAGLSPAPAAPAGGSVLGAQADRPSPADADADAAAI